MDALDGIRGILLILLLCYHLGVSQLAGAWTGINLFFILSGFLIARMLVQERLRTGRIRFWRFYAGRARRLFPALGALLVVVLLYGYLFAPDSVRGGLRWDVLATMGYFMNWRLIAQGNQYFVQYTEPSMLQHAWTLSVEEQFYLLAPLLLLGLVKWLQTRRAVVIALLVLATASAAWMAWVGNDSDQAWSHFYYGTDTRAQSLLLGAALGVWLSRRRPGRVPIHARMSVVQTIGWAGLAITLAGIVLARPELWIMPRGGMLLLSFAAVAWVWAAADERHGLLQRVLGFAPLAALGRMLYSVYLWHWPITLWLQQALPAAPAWQRLLIGFPLILGVSTISYQRLERPVHENGWRAFLGGMPRSRSRGVAIGVILALAVGALTLQGGPSQALGLPAQEPAGPIPNLVKDQLAYRPPRTTQTIAVFGDSVPDRLAHDFPAADFKGLKVVDAAKSGCDLLPQPYINPGTGDQEPAASDCVAARRKWPEQLEGKGAKLLLVFPERLLTLYHVIDGQQRRGDDPTYVHWINSELDIVNNGARRNGARVAVLTMPCFDPKSISQQFLTTMRTKDPAALAEFRNPKQINAVFRAWAAQHGAPVIDLKSAVCGAGSTPARPHGVSLYADGVHFSPWGAKVVWKWLAPQALLAIGEKS